MEEQGHSSDAKAEWEAIAKAHPEDVQAYAHLGLLEAHEEHYKQATHYYLKALALSPNNPQLRLDLGLAYFKGGQLDSAIKMFTPLLREARAGSSDELRLTTLIGLADYGMGAYTAAIPHLKKATAADPQNIPFRLMLAHSCLWSKQYQCVLDIYREILTLDPDSAEADMLAGEAYDEMKNEQGAIEQFRAAVKAGPKVPNVHFGYGYLLWRLLKFDEAEKEFRSELANNPEHPLALTYLADTEIHLKRSEDAAQDLQRAIHLDPSITLAHLDLGIVYEGQRRDSEAVRELIAAESLSPDDPQTHWQLGRLYRSLGREAEARAEFAKTRHLQEAANQSLVQKLHEAESKPAAQNAVTGAK